MDRLILFIFLALLPFGQVLRLPIEVLGHSFSLNASDALALLATFWAVFTKLKPPVFWKAVEDFIYVAAFSLFASLSFFSPVGLFSGLFYLVRIVSYFYLFSVLSHFLGKRPGFKGTVFNGLILSTAFVAVFGWLQYLIYPDLRSLLYLNWDEHLLRMVGGFLDPTFTGIFLVFGIILSSLNYLKNKKRSLLFLILFLLISLAFTYSRSSYLALGVSLAAIWSLTKKSKEIILLGGIFLSLVFLLPGGEGEGVKLGRTASILAKGENYRQSISLAAISPIFGIGYNNVCLAKQVYLSDVGTESHACSGLDSSFLFLLVTTGVLGVFSFINLITAIAKNVRRDIYGNALVASFFAILIHSLFANSFFYSWTMGTFAILLSLGLKENT